MPSRANGTSWVRAQATPYRVILRSVRNGSVVGAWTEAWSLSAQIAKLTYASADTWVGTDLTYLGYSRGALVYAAKHGAQVGENLSWATGQINAKGWKSPYKWRLGDGLR